MDNSGQIAQGGAEYVVTQCNTEFVPKLVVITTIRKTSPYMHGLSNTNTLAALFTELLELASIENRALLLEDVIKEDLKTTSLK